MNEVFDFLQTWENIYQHGGILSRLKKLFSKWGTCRIGKQLDKPTPWEKNSITQFIFFVQHFEAIFALLSASFLKICTSFPNRRNSQNFQKLFQLWSPQLPPFDVPLVYGNHSQIWNSCKGVLASFKDALKRVSNNLKWDRKFFKEPQSGLKHYETYPDGCSKVFSITSSVSSITASELLQIKYHSLLTNNQLLQTFLVFSFMKSRMNWKLTCNKKEFDIKKEKKIILV